jgi:hypothetical protein
MATAAAAVLAKARRDVVSHFMQAGAVSPETAVAFNPTRRIQGRMFERLSRRGVILKGNGDRHYLDVAALDKYARSRRRRAGLAAAGIAAIGAAFAFLG